jgi:hypothetical protein
MSDETVWQSEWPTEPGLWWFCGYRHHRDAWPVKIICEAMRGLGELPEVVDGYNIAMDPNSCGPHRWTKVIEPVAPPEILVTMDDQGMRLEAPTRSPGV